MRTRNPSPTRPSVALPDVFRTELDSFLLACEAENLAPKTRRTSDNSAVTYYGSALTAHPGESQGRPCTNAGSRLTC